MGRRGHWTKRKLVRQSLPGRVMDMAMREKRYWTRAPCPVVIGGRGRNKLSSGTLFGSFVNREFANDFQHRRGGKHADLMIDRIVLPQKIARECGLLATGPYSFISISLPKHRHSGRGIRIANPILHPFELISELGSCPVPSEFRTKAQEPYYKDERP
jgi:hypothetical protein